MVNHLLMVDKWEKILIWIGLTSLILAFIYIVTYPYYLNEDPMYYVFGIPDIDNRMINGDDYWDVSFEIIDHEERDRAEWTDIEIIVYNQSGRELLRTRVIKENNPVMYDNGTNGTVNVEVWHVDISQKRFLNTGDTLIFTGLTDEYQGAYFWIQYIPRNNPIARGEFPISFD